jgi:hypothetical protein
MTVELRAAAPIRGEKAAGEAALPFILRQAQDERAVCHA